MKNPQWPQLRENYPVTKQGAYLKNASISGMHQAVLEEMEKFQREMAFKAGIQEGRFFDVLMESKEVLSSFIGAAPEDVALLENSSHNMNIVAMMLEQEKKSGRNHILMVEDEFPSCALPFFHHGFEVELVPTREGCFDEGDLLERVSKKTIAIVASTVQFSTGFRLHPEKLCSQALEKDIHIILNTTQSLGVFPINVLELGVSALTSSCHKWLGAGIGQALLYLSKEFRNERRYPLAGWCSVAEPFEMRNNPPLPREDVGALQLGSLPFVPIVGVTKACKVLQEIGLKNIQERVLDLNSILRKELNHLGLKTLGAKERDRQSGIVTFEMKEASHFVEDLESKGIYVNERRGKVRVSPHFFNNAEDLEVFLKELSLKA